MSDAETALTACAMASLQLRDRRAKRERVAAAIWDTYAASPVAQEGSKGLSWDDLRGMAEMHGPDSASGLCRATALAEAEAAMRAMEAFDA